MSEALCTFEENSQGFFRVRLPNGRIMLDTDLMFACVSSHVSKPLTYVSKSAAYRGYVEYLRKQETIKEMSAKLSSGGAGGSGMSGGYEPLKIAEDFKPIT